PPASKPPASPSPAAGNAEPAWTEAGWRNQDGPMKSVYSRHSHHKFELLAVWNQAALEGPAQKSPDGFPAALAVIQRPVVHVHAHEFVRQVAAHVARILQRVLHRFGPMLQAESDAGRQDVGYLPAHVRREFFVNDIAAERQRQAVVDCAPP